MTNVKTGERDRVLDAMRSGEWLRSQWIARVAFDLGDGPWAIDAGIATTRILRELESEGIAERRDAQEQRRGDVYGVQTKYMIPRSEWRLRR